MELYRIISEGDVGNPAALRKDTDNLRANLANHQDMLDKIGLTFEAERRLMAVVFNGHQELQKVLGDGYFEGCASKTLQPVSSGNKTGNEIGSTAFTAVPYEDHPLVKKKFSKYKQSRNGKKKVK